MYIGAVFCVVCLLLLLFCFLLVLLFGDGGGLKDTLEPFQDMTFIVFNIHAV